MIKHFLRRRLAVYQIKSLCGTYSASLSFDPQVDSTVGSLLPLLPGKCSWFSPHYLFPEVTNRSPLPRSSSRKPDLHVLMTRPDRPLNPATLACLFPCSLQVCPELEKRLLYRFNHPRRRALHAWRSHTLLRPFPRRRAPFATNPATEAVENP